MPGFTLPSLPFSDPVLIFGTIMVLILIFPAIARKIHLPEIIGLIAAGILIGPYGLGFIARDATIELLGKVGLLYIMFLAGLEIDLQQVKQNNKPTLAFGLLTFLIPLGMGTALGYWVFGMSIPVSILLASMFSSHTLLTFPDAIKLGLAKNPSVTTTVGGTIITDTLALLILAVIASSSQGDTSLLFWVQLFGLMTLYMVGTMFLIPRIGHWFFRKQGTNSDIEFVFVLAMTFVFSYLAHLAGLEPIIGAFLAGISLNNLIPEKSLLMSRIHFTGDTIFIPFFLISTGMLVNGALLFSEWNVWIIIIGMVLIALISKALAAAISGVLLKYRKSETMLMYGLSVNQAAATLAAVLVGYQLELFDDSVITGTIMMIAVTCFAGSLITSRAGRKVALEDSQLPVPDQLSNPRVLIPQGGRRYAKELLDLGILLRPKDNPEPIYPVRVVIDSPQVNQDIALAEKILAHSVVRGMAAGVPIIPLTTVDLNVASGILRSTRDNRANTLLLGWSGKRKVKTRTFGRNADEIVDKSTAQILISRLGRPLNSSKNLVVLLPPYAHRQRGYEQVWKTIKTLRTQVGAEIIIWMNQTTRDEQPEVFGSKTGKTTIKIQILENWKVGYSVISPTIADDDWIIIMKPRKGDLMWQPSLDRLPNQFAEGFPKNNLTVIVPPRYNKDEQPSQHELTPDSPILRGFDPGRCTFRGDFSTIQECLTKLLAPGLARFSRQTKHLIEELLHISREEPVELIQDVVLLHTHSSLVSQSEIYLGVNKNPLDIPLASGGPRIIVVLLDPIGQDPALHLQALADLARVIRLQGLVPSLQKIRNYEEFSQEIQRRIQTG